MIETRPTLLPALVFGVATVVLVALGAFGFLVRVGHTTLTGKEAACFGIAGLVLGGMSLGYSALCVVQPSRREPGAVLVADEGGCVLAALATPMVIASGCFVALGLAQMVHGSLVGAGLLAPAIVVLVGAGVLLDARYVVRQLEDQSLVVSAGRLLPRERRIPAARFDRLRISNRRYRGRDVFVVTLSVHGGGEVRLGRWFTAVEAENVAAKVSR